MALIEKSRVVEKNAAKAAEVYAHAFGSRDGKRLALNFLEAAYLAGMEKLEVRAGKKSLGEKELLSLALKKDRLAGKKYAVLKDLRKGGRAVRFSETDDWLRVYERGKRFGEAPSVYLVRVVEGGRKRAEREIAGEAESAHGVRKKLVWAFVEKGKPVYYSIEKTRL